MPFLKIVSLSIVALGPTLAFGNCLEEAPHPSDAISSTCADLGAFALNRGSYSEIPYEIAPDGLMKEHHPPMGPRSPLLDFTKAHTGKLYKLVKTELPKYCAYYYQGQRYNLKDGKENMAFLFRRNKGTEYDKALLDQVMKGKNQLSVGDLARSSSEFSHAAKILGDEIFQEQLVSHAAALDPDYQREYLRKMKAVIASLNKGPKEFQASDCDYLNAPINYSGFYNFRVSPRRW